MPEGRKPGGPWVKVALDGIRVDTLDQNTMASCNHSIVSAKEQVIAFKTLFVYCMLQTKSSNGRISEHDSFQINPAPQVMH